MSQTTYQSTHHPTFQYFRSFFSKRKHDPKFNAPWLLHVFSNNHANLQYTGWAEIYPLESFLFQGCQSLDYLTLIRDDYNITEMTADIRWPQFTNIIQRLPKKWPKHKHAQKDMHIFKKVDSNTSTYIH